MTPDDQILAAELTLGLLDDTGLAAARARVAEEPNFATEVAWWRDRLSALHVDYASAPPDASLEDRIAALVAERTAAAAPRVTAQRATRRWPWFAGGAAAGAMAAALAAMLLLTPATVPRPAPTTSPATDPTPAPAARLLAAAIVPAEGQSFAALPIVVRPDAHAIRVAAPDTVPPRRVAQLWRIGSDGVPHSLGLLHTGGATELRLTVTLTPGDTLAISIEPTGGSPKPTPSGPVVATGKLVRA